MPENKNLEPVNLPQAIRFGEKPTTKFLNNLEAMRVELINAPTIEQMINTVVPFAKATWADDALDYANNMSTLDKYQTVYDTFHFKYLPQSLENVDLTFYIRGIDLQTVTHILRYRKATFSAECSDKWWTDKDALVPNSIQNSKEFYDRYKKVVEDAKQLYCDMVDSKEVPLMDARHIFPRCLETFYLMRVNFLDFLNIVKQRTDKQLQPEEDNYLVRLMYEEVIKKIPFAIHSADFHAPAMHFIKTARLGKGNNFYIPEEDNDKFEWNRADFVYDKKRTEMNGTDEGAENLYVKLEAESDARIETLTKEAEEKLEKLAGGKLQF